jgi:hypothetical protein
MYMRKKNAETEYWGKGFHRPKAGDRFKSMGGTSEVVNVSVGVPMGTGGVFSGFRMLGYPVAGKGAWWGLYEVVGVLRGLQIF